MHGHLNVIYVDTIFVTAVGVLSVVRTCFQQAYSGPHTQV